MTHGVRDLRVQAVSRALFPATTLGAALRRVAFVQADPIRAPACAQDLILRHRVAGYRAGDLERRYPGLAVEEGCLYAYGFMPRSLWHLAHPRDTTRLSGLEARVLAAVQRLGRVHPRDLEGHFGRDRRRNAWGGRSKATTLALDALQHRGLLRVTGRESGVRVYEPSLAVEAPSPTAALRRLALAVAAVLAPVPAPTLRAIVSRLRRRLRHAEGAQALVCDLVRRGDLERHVVDGIEYLWPPGATPGDVPRTVRLLAPFDPLVWDRRRFEHLWGWAYRFEAYTPVARRVRGYYALPLLWVERVVGWANARLDDGGRLQVEPGFVGERPRGGEFRRELEAEVERLGRFLARPPGSARPHPPRGTTS